MGFTHVLTPYRIGSVTLRNRVVRNAHHTGFSHAHDAKTVIDYHVERAIGGCGLTILEASSVHPSSVLRGGPRLFESDTLANLANLMTAIRPHGMAVFQQLWHGGNVSLAHDGGPPLAASTIPGHSGQVGRPATRREIAEIVDAFAQTARGCKAAGLDGVEVAGGHGYLLHQFMSSYHNNRDDEYGGVFENRARIVREVLAAIRASAGDIVLGIRLSVSEAPGGIGEDDLIALLGMIEREYLADYINISMGDYYRSGTVAAAMDHPAGYELPYTERLRAACSLPRIVNGRFRTLEEADQVIRDGAAELVGLTRPQIADPMLVRKTIEGRAGEVRPCIACNQGCLGGVFRFGALGCTVNPAVGREAEHAERLLSKEVAPAKLLVVGGGPAGMEAARIGALRGHQVTLMEASTRLGGAINLARRMPKAHGLADITNWLEREIFRLGVDVRFSSYVDASDVLDAQADSVVIATGAQPRKDGILVSNPGQRISGIGLPHVLSSSELLTAGSGPVGGTAVIFDMVGHMEAAGVAEYLLQAGARVRLVSHLGALFPMAQFAIRDGAIWERLHAMGDFEAYLRHELIAIEPDKCLIRPLFDLENRRARMLDADMVVVIAPGEPARSLYDELRDRQDNLILIGDALSPRDLQVAIAEGHNAGLAPPKGLLVCSPA